MKITTVEEALARQKELLGFDPNNYEESLEVIKFNGLYFKCVNPKIHTEEMCMEAIKSNYHNLKYIKVSIQTYEMAMEAVKKGGICILKYISLPLINEKLILEAIQNTVPVRFYQEYLPRQFQTEKVCLEIVKKNADYFEFVNSDLQTEEMAMEAVKQNGFLLLYVRKDLQTEEMAMEAVKNNRKAIEFVSKEFLSKKLYLIHIRNHPETFNKLPLKFQTKEFLLEAINADNSVLETMHDFSLLEEDDDIEDENNKTIRLIRSNQLPLSSLTSELQTEELCIEAIKNNYKNIKFVREDLRTTKVLNTAMNCFVSNNYDRLIDLIDFADKDKFRRE